MKFFVLLTFIIAKRTGHRGKVEMKENYVLLKNFSHSLAVITKAKPFRGGNGFNSFNFIQRRANIK
jgi:hypothetical protein